MIKTSAPLAVQICGLLDAPPLVFLHSIGCDSDMWRDQAVRLQDRRRVFCVDLPGHGLSAAIDTAPDMHRMAAKVVETLAALEVEAFDMAGLSLGGMVAAAVALDHPKRVRRLAICDARLDAPDDYRALWDRLSVMAAGEGMDAIANFMVERWFGQGKRAANPRVADIAAAIRRTPHKGFEAAARAIQELNLLTRVESIAAPTLLMVGEEDGALPEVMADICSRMPNAKLTVLAGAGHLSNIDQPEAFTAALLDHLQA